MHLTVENTCNTKSNTSSEKKIDVSSKYVKKWRPMSLLNYGFKIGSKAITLQIENDFPDLIIAD